MVIFIIINLMKKISILRDSLMDAGCRFLMLKASEKTSDLTV